MNSYQYGSHQDALVYSKLKKKMMIRVRASIVVTRRLVVATRERHPRRTNGLCKRAPLAPAASGRGRRGGGPRLARTHAPSALLSITNAPILNMRHANLGSMRQVYDLRGRGTGPRPNATTTARRAKARRLTFLVREQRTQRHRQSSRVTHVCRTLRDSAAVSDSASTRR